MSKYYCVLTIAFLISCVKQNVKNYKETRLDSMHDMIQELNQRSINDFDISLDSNSSYYDSSFQYSADSTYTEIKNQLDSLEIMLDQLNKRDTNSYRVIENTNSVPNGYHPIKTTK